MCRICLTKTTGWAKKLLLLDVLLLLFLLPYLSFAVVSCDNDLL